MTAKLRAKIVTGDSYKLGEGFVVKYVLTNEGADDVYVLCRDTPLEGLRSDCFIVMRDGKERLKYDGPLIKRGAPVPEEYILVRAGDKVSKEVALADTYPMDLPGLYTVSLRNSNVETMPAAGAAMTEAAVAARASVHEIASVEMEQIEMMVDESSDSPHLTEGQRARENEMLEEDDDEEADDEAESAPAALVAGARSPKIKGGSNSQRSTVRQAHRDAFELTRGAIDILDNDAHYQEWFGEHTDERFARVEEVLTSVRDKMVSTRFIYNLSGDGCGPSDYAYTYVGVITVWMCGGFWTAPATGTASKAGTILHEHTHASAGVDDIAYEQEDCRQLAIDFPDEAIANADSYEFFAGG